VGYSIVSQPNPMKRYSAHSNTEFQECDSLEEAIDIAMSMAVHFGSSYVIDNETNKVVEEF
jgi:hypothetical protein